MRVKKDGYLLALHTRFAAVCAEVLLFRKRILLAVALLMQAPVLAAAASEQTSEFAAVTQVREELWGIPSTIPMLAYVVRPVGDGPFPLVVMNHGVALDPKERSYFPIV